MERSLPPEDMAEQAGGVLDAMEPCDDMDVWEVATEPSPSDVEPSSPVLVSEDEFAFLDDDFPLFDVDAESTLVRPLVHGRRQVH